MKKIFLSLIAVAAMAVSANATLPAKMKADRKFAEEAEKEYRRAISA